MDKVTVNKDDLIMKIQENRLKHIENFDAAIEGYRELCVEKLEEHIARIKNGAVETVRVHVPAPEDHTEDYDAALEMLEMSVHDTITLDDYTFRQLVLDEWNWKPGFMETVQTYTQV